MPPTLVSWTPGAGSGKWNSMTRVANSAPFSTPWDKYRWTRLPFGLTCSGDVFQEKMGTIFGKLDGLSGIADDTFVYGKSEQEHDQHILNVLDTARDNNVRFNPDKFQLKVDQTSLFWVYVDSGWTKS